MTGVLQNAAPIVFVVAILTLQAVAKARRPKTRRRAREAAAAGAPLTGRIPGVAAPSAVAPTVPAPPRPARRPPPPVPPPAPAAPAPSRTGIGAAASPRWAANAIIAAEVFGPPVAQRPGGTLGPPAAL